MRRSRWGESGTDENEEEQMRSKEASHQNEEEVE